MKDAICNLRPRYNLKRFIRLVIGGMLNNFHKLNNSLDRLRLQLIVGEIGWKSKIYEGVMLIGCPANISLGVRVEIFHQGVLAVGPNGRIEFGDRSHLGVASYLNAVEGRILIGSGVAIAPLTQIYAYSNSVEVGKKIRESYRVADVVIEDDVLIGSAVTILPGVTIGKGAVVGAGAVVNRDVPQYTVVAGVPARKIRKREQNPSQGEIKAA